VNDTIFQKPKKFIKVICSFNLQKESERSANGGEARETRKFPVSNANCRIALSRIPSYDFLQKQTDMTFPRNKQNFFMTCSNFKTYFSHIAKQCFANHPHYPIMQYIRVSHFQV
jgi:hypothetical protein